MNNSDISIYAPKSVRNYLLRLYGKNKYHIVIKEINETVSRIHSNNLPYLARAQDRLLDDLREVVINEQRRDTGKSIRHIRRINNDLAEIIKIKNSISNHIIKFERIRDRLFRDIEDIKKQGVIRFNKGGYRIFSWIDKYKDKIQDELQLDIDLLGSYLNEINELPSVFDMKFDRYQFGTKVKYGRYHQNELLPGSRRLICELVKYLLNNKWIEIQPRKKKKGVTQSKRTNAISLVADVLVLYNYRNQNPALNREIRDKKIIKRHTQQYRKGVYDQIKKLINSK